MSHGGQGHASSRRHHRGSMSTTTLVAAGKVALASAAVAAAASFARLAVPELVSAAGAVFPRLWAVARFWLAPPYLFVTVHLIILVIWKLSDHKQHFHHHQKDPWPVAAMANHHAAACAIKAKEEEEELAGAEAAYSEHLEQQFSPDSGGGDSCVTTESDEDASSAPPTSSYYSVEAQELSRRSVTFAPVQQERAAAVLLERNLSLPSSHQSVDDSEAGDDDLDATWNAIMQKTRSAPPPPAQQPPPPRARDPSLGAEEMNRRFDDFIKKNRNSFGRHQ